MISGIEARDIFKKELYKVKKIFGDLIDERLEYDTQFIDISLNHVMAIGGFNFKVPALKELLKEEELAVFLNKMTSKKSHLFVINWKNLKVDYYTSCDDEIIQQQIEAHIEGLIVKVCKDYEKWAGYINEKGEHVIDLKKPVPGPHFYTNMLLGDRMNFFAALQSTPKSVVDRFGGGSFRAHAATQVLATRWDMLPEENGFPANRQFYIVEEGKQIFYSADVLDKNIKSATCRHCQNHTVIEYETYCGLKVIRTIFLLPQYEGLPVATEVQRISLINTTFKKRTLKVVTIGMLATAVPGALMEDVVYSNVIMQAKIIKDKGNNMIAYMPSYYPENASTDMRFTTLMAYEKDKKKYADELCTHYGEFIGSGSLYRPQGLAKLTNKLNTKGPGFFALGCSLEIEPEGTLYIDHFTGLISKLEKKRVPEEFIKEQLENLHNKFNEQTQVDRSLQQQQRSYEKYSSYLQIETGDWKFDTYVNKNLPFQVLYQTFVSRSFDLTQKGYREIGFREIQDIFVSQYYLVSMGEIEYTKSLLREWIEKVFEYGYCYHNFFWKGKEAGKWSDDGLWLVQAVFRYVNYTGDIAFLNEQYEIPESQGKKRSVYETLKAIIKYSSEISIGEHGFPLIDFADWNDCLKVDDNYLTGPQKEKTSPPYKGYSESIMNAFLLKLAVDHMGAFASLRNDKVYGGYMKDLTEKLSDSIQKYAWKEDFFARVLFNRFGEDITYLGARGDGFSADKDIQGTYFLNAFSWAILSDSATQTQIATMLDQIEAYLKTPYGLKLMSPTDLSKVAKATATGEYFPGDRENGGIFKHATMMATAAMLQAAKKLEDRVLADRLRSLAYWMVELVLPYNTLDNPFEKCGNPRWCTQYNNSQTGENIGPTLSGTSTWLGITLFEMFGIEYFKDHLIINPLLADETNRVNYTLRFLTSTYRIEMTKPKGLYRIKDGGYEVVVDGIKIEGNKVALRDDGKEHHVILTFN